MADSITKVLQILFKADGAAGVKTETDNLAASISGGLRNAVVGLVGAYFTLEGTQKLLRESFEWTFGAAIKEEAINHRLAAALELRGESYEKNGVRIENFIRSLKRNSIYDDEELTSTFQKVYQITGDVDKAMAGTKLALDITAGGFGDLEGNVIIATRAMTEGKAMIGRMVFSLAELQDKFKNTGQNEINTFSGQIKILNREIDDTGKSLAHIFLPALSALLLAAKAGKGVESLSSMIENIAKAINSIEASSIMKILLGLEALSNPGFAANLMQAGKAIRDIETLNSLGMMPAHRLTIDNIREEAAARAKAMEEAAEKENVFYDLKQRTTAQMIALYEQLYKAYEGNVDKQTEIEKTLHSLKMQNLKEEIEASQKAGLLHDFRSIPLGVPTSGEPIQNPGGLTFPGQKSQMSGLVQSDISAFWDGIKDQWKIATKSTSVAIYSGVQGIFDGLRGIMADWVSSLGNIAFSLASGDIASAASNFVGLMISAFTADSEREKKRAAERKRVLDEYNKQIEENIKNIELMTDAEKKRRELEIKLEMERLKAEIAQMQLLPEWLQNKKQIAFDQGILASLGEELGAIIGNFADDSTIRNIKNFGQAMAYVTGQGGNTDYNKSKTLIDHWTEMFNLTAEQQIQLWQEVLDNLQAAGNITTDQMWSIQETIKQLRESGATGGAGSQVLRSVAQITENQANLMLGVLNTLREYVSQILQIMQGAMPAGYSASSSGGISINNLTINASGISEGRAVAKALRDEFRSRGGKVSA